MSYVPVARQPTGIPAAPLILVSGPAKSGKSLTAYKLGLSERIDHCWVIDLGEGSADEYGTIGGYEVLEWGRSWADLTDSIKWCVAQPAGKGLLNAVVIDSGSEVWEGLKDRAGKRARGSKKNRAELAKDPDFEVDVSMPYWTDAKETWARIVSPLKLAPHVVGVVIVRADEVAEVANGVPTKNRVVSLQCEKSLPAVVTAHVQVRPDHTAWLVEVRSMNVSVDPKGRKLGDNPLGEVVDLLAPADGVFQAPAVQTPVDDARGEQGADPAHAAAVELHRQLSALSDEQRAAMREWVNAGSHSLTVPAMAQSAALRKAVTAQLAEIAAGGVEQPELAAQQ